MTEEEMAKEYVDTLLNKDDTELDKFLDENLVGLKLNEKQAGTILGAIKGVGICSFLAGLKAGKPKFHKVADGKYPSKEQLGKSFIVAFGFNERTQEYYSFDCAEYIDKGKFCTHTNNDDKVIAWCEIPKYTEE